jgi:hypothetical protein
MITINQNIDSLRHRHITRSFHYSTIYIFPCIQYVHWAQFCLGFR